MAPYNVTGYDSTHLFFRMAESQQGKTFDGAAAIEAIRGYKWTSPRGPAMIDPASRDIVQNYYIRRVQKIDGQLRNVVVQTYPQQPPQF